jgi:chromatin modification-related protein EAF6
MAENAPPTGAPNAASDASRGMPYYERLRRDLRESLANKRKIDSSIVRTTGKNQLRQHTYLYQARLEETIMQAETTYLEETSAGNIIKGFDNYIKGATSTSTSGGPGTATRRKAPISDVDRIFSRSSNSFLRVYTTLV